MAYKNAHMQSQQVFSLNDTGYKMRAGYGVVEAAVAPILPTDRGPKIA